jgi:hypothetical protein
MELRGTSDKRDDGSFEPVEASAQEVDEVRDKVKNRSLRTEGCGTRLEMTEERSKSVACDSEGCRTRLRNISWT